MIQLRYYVESCLCNSKLMPDKNKAQVIPNMLISLVLLLCAFLNSFFKCCIAGKLSVEVWLHLEHIIFQIKVHGWGGVGGVLDQMKIMPQVEVQLGLSLAINNLEWSIKFVSDFK
jgi:hypothetical protein